MSNKKDAMRKAMLWAYNLNAGKSAAQMDVINYNLETLFNDYFASQRMERDVSDSDIESKLIDLMKNTSHLMQHDRIRISKEFSGWMRNELKSK